MREDDTVKVLDFGLAKALGPTEAGHYVASGGGEHRGVRLQRDLTNSPTVSLAATQAGMILGTAAYMAPEQARGKPADKRADVWALGCVLFEMLTGRRAFDGEDVALVLAAVLKSDPAWTAMPSELPKPLPRLLRACLEKERANRPHIGAAAFILKRAADFTESVQQVTAPEPLAARGSMWRGAIPAAAAGVAATLLTAAAAWWMLAPGPPTVIRTVVTTSGATALNQSGADRDVAITPDGTRIVYRGANQLLVRPLSQLEPTVLNNVGSPRGVFISPDGQWVGYFDGTSFMKKVAITGGPALTITPIDSGAPHGATWGPDDAIVFATSNPESGLYRVPAAGGEPVMLTKPERDRGEVDHLWPEFLPDGQSLLYTLTAGEGGEAPIAQIAVLDVRTGSRKVIVNGGSHAHYVATGHLVYAVNGTLRAVPFDLGAREVTGNPALVLEGVVTLGTGAGNVALASNGTIVYVTGTASAGAQRLLTWVDRMGREAPVPAPPRAYFFPRISPDGTRVAIEVNDPEQDIWIWDFMRQTLTRLTFHPGNDQFPAWTPDSRRVLFASARSGPVSVVYSQAADGTGNVERLSQNPSSLLPQVVTPDGRAVVVRDLNQQNLALLPLDGNGRSQPLMATTFIESGAELSPDGRWLAYQSNESGRDEIYVRPFPDVNAGRWQVSTGGGRMPLWARDGNELFYVAPLSRPATYGDVIMRVQVESGTSWHATTPSTVFQGPYFFPRGNASRSFDISPDGRQFLMIKVPGEQSAASESLVVVQNWLEELKRLVPTQ